ncbi:hypothetical protein BH23BAC1_BH23BAC1_33780 [soil metagenome]
MVESETIKFTKKEREDLFITLYEELFPEVASYVSKMGGSLEETRDIFQDALVVYFEKLNNNPDNIQSERAYVVGIAKNLWIQKFRKDKKLNSFLNYNKNIDPEAETEIKPSAGTLFKTLEKAGKKCMHMLQAFYYEKLSMAEVASQFGFSGVRSATVQKYKCLEKVRDVIKEKSMNYEDFLE